MTSWSAFFVLDQKTARALEPQRCSIKLFNHDYARRSLLFEEMFFGSDLLPN